MDTRQALDVLGLEPGAGPDEVRARYRHLLRVHHPDVAAAAAEAATARTTAVIEAYRWLVATGTDVEPTAPAAPAAPAPAPPPAPPPPAAASPAGWSTSADAGLLVDGTLAVGAPPDETYALLHEAAGRIGEVAYVDPHLGILETVIRFEGGPTCSLVLTLQGRADHTEVFCTMESIEAAPTPPIGPALDALVEELQALA